MRFTCEARKLKKSKQGETKRKDVKRDEAAAG